MAKISELVDLFNGTTLDTTKWFENRPPAPPTPDPATTVTVSGGNLNIYQGTTNVTLTSLDNYDWQNSQLVFGPFSGRFTINLGGGGSGLLYKNATNLVLDANFGTIVGSVAYNATTMKYIRVTRTTSSTSVHYSANNNNWTLLGTYSGTPPTAYPVQLGVGASSQSLTLGAINPPANASPTSEIISPANFEGVTSDNPVLSFESSDFEGESAVFNVQISSGSDMSVLHEEGFSDSTAGFSAGSPYANGATATYTVQNPLTSGVVSYYWRVRAKDPTGTNIYGAWTPTQRMISQPDPPTLTSGTSSSVMATTATASGEVLSDGGGAIIERGIAYGTAVDPTISGTKKTASGTTGVFNANLISLVPNTLYHWRAYATNSRTTSYGADNTFTTLPTTSTITSIASITDSSADVNVNIPSGGGADITERGIVYSTSPEPTTESNKITSGSGTGAFTVPMTGLTGLTTYYVAGYAINSQGTTYSLDTSFQTLETPGVATVITGTIGDITTSSATVTGSEVTLDGTYAVTERGVVLSSTNDDPTISDTKIAATGAGLGVYDVDITTLDPETFYYIRAYATNPEGTAYGEIKTFTSVALFVPDAGDGYWTWLPDGSNITVGRSQPTASYSSANVLLKELGLEDGEQYTLYYASVTSDTGSPYVVLQWYDNLVKQQQVITAGQPYTFTYDKTKLSWALRLFVTGATPEPNNIEAVFEDFYLAKESAFSDFVPFVNKGLTEIKLDNNWLLDKRRETTIESIFDAVHGMGWRQFTAKTTGLGWFEVGDLITIVDNEGSRQVIVWNSKITIDGAVKETLSALPPEKTETDYNKAGQITKSLRRTQISVDHNEQEILSLVEDVRSEDGIVNVKFTEIEQSIDAVSTTVQSSGGVNLVRNSVMYSFSDDGVPDYWAVLGTGALTIQASPESLSGGGTSGNVFTLSNEEVSQNVTVRKDVDFIPEDQKLYYSFSARVRKNTVGVASITLSNRNESHTINLPDQREYYWEAVSIVGLLPLDDHYDITIQSDADASLQVTDVMLSPGNNTRQWTQSNGESMNTNVAITDDGMTIRSSVFRNDYTRIDALGFEVHKHDAGGVRVFGFNGDETNVRSLRADNQLSVATIRMVPVEYDSYNGIAFTRTEDN